MSSRTSALDAVVYGVDVQSGDVRGDAPSFALVVFDGDSIERDVVTYRKLRRLIADESPAIVATDNVYELAEDRDDLVRFLGSLPDGTRLVQVTGAEQPEPLSRVAGRHGVPYGKDPMQEAEAAARLAAANVGQEVTAFTDRTNVKVARGRSTGSGGWSEDRYTRRIHGAVKTRSRDVESELDEANLDYEKEVTEKYGGFSRAVFEVEARPEDIPVSRERSGDTRIEIERQRRDGIEFRPLAKRRDHVLVGIDPGTTTAVATVDLDGTVLDTLSTRTADTAEVTEWIIERGRPLLVAADVTPMPETVEKIRRSFDAVGWTPGSDLPIDEKQHRTREQPYDNDHERDAMAAALEAFDDHADQFERIARKVPPRMDRGEVTASVLRSEGSVEAVLAEMTDDGEDEGDSTEQPDNEQSPEQRRISDLERQVDRLDSFVDDLEGEIADRDERIDELEAELSETRQEERKEARNRREVSRLEREVSRLERELEAERERNEELEGKLERLKALWKLDHSNFSDVSAEKEGLVPVKPIAEFTRAAIEEAHDTYGIAEGDVVYLRDAGGAGRSTAQKLLQFEPRVVLKNGGLSEVADRILFENGIPVGPAEEVAMQEVDELAVAREEDVESVIDDWEDRAEERRRDRTAETIDRIISEHRAEDRSADGRS